MAKSKKQVGEIFCSKLVVYPGSFDPLTDGHINIIRRGLQIFDKVVVAVAHNTSKRTLFSTQERVDMIKEIFRDEPKVEVDTFEGLLVNYCRSRGMRVILRGLRTVSDFEFEFQMALANKQMAPDIETFFMMTESSYSHISSTILREVIQLGGSGKGMIPLSVEKKMRKKLGKLK
jgi:pantetheine-phosphate adenylyltransferase